MSEYVLVLPSASDCARSDRHRYGRGVSRGRSARAPRGRRQGGCRGRPRHWRHRRVVLGHRRRSAVVGRQGVLALSGRPGVVPVASDGATRRCGAWRRGGHRCRAAGGHGSRVDRLSDRFPPENGRRRRTRGPGRRVSRPRPAGLWRWWISHVAAPAGLPGAGVRRGRSRR